MALDCPVCGSVSLTRLPAKFQGLSRYSCNRCQETFNTNRLPDGRLPDEVEEEQNEPDYIPADAYSD